MTVHRIGARTVVHGPTGWSVWLPSLDEWVPLPLTADATLMTVRFHLAILPVRRSYPASGTVAQWYRDGRR